jgi:hypothetical protein
MYLSLLQSLQAKYPGIELTVRISNLQVYKQQELPKYPGLFSVNDFNYAYGLFNAVTGSGYITTINQHDGTMFPLIRIHFNR